MGFKWRKFFQLLEQQSNLNRWLADAAAARATEKNILEPLPLQTELLTITHQQKEPKMTDRKQVKKLTIEITDIEQLKAVYPQVVKTETVTTEVVDRQLLRPIVNAMRSIGQTVPGVHAYFAHEEEGATPPPPSNS